jgi:hypothetical protein
MKTFISYISENAPESAPKPERKIGKVKYWMNLRDKQDGEEPFREVEYTRKVKSDTVPNANWYFLGDTPMSGMSRGERRYRAAVVLLIDTHGILLATVKEDAKISKGNYGRWQSGDFWTDNFTAAKRHAEDLALRRSAHIGAKVGKQ